MNLTAGEGCYTGLMTAKEALREMIDHLTDRQAAEWLLQMRDVPPPIPWRQRPVPPTWQEMAAMSVAERREVFLLWPPSMDEEDLAEMKIWDEGTLSVIDLIDD